MNDEKWLKENDDDLLDELLLQQKTDRDNWGIVCPNCQWYDQATKPCGLDCLDFKK